jgi:hypothetical protein
LLPTSPISDVIDSKPSTPETVTFPKDVSQRDTIDSIMSNLNNSDVTFDSNIVEPAQSLKSLDNDSTLSVSSDSDTTKSLIRRLNEVDPIITEIDTMLDENKPFLTDDQMNELVKQLKNKALKKDKFIIESPYESNVNIFNLVKNKLFYLSPLLFIVSIKNNKLVINKWNSFKKQFNNLLKNR